MLKFWRDKPPSSLAFVAALLALLALLATLQYRWLNQVSEGVHERMRSNVHAGAQRFAEDFDREIARAYVNFQMDEGTLRERNWNDYSMRYRRWLSTALHPQLVKDLFLVKADERGEFGLWRFDRTTDRFNAAEWTAELESLRGRLERQPQDVLTHVDFPAENIPVPVDDKIPAIIIPVTPTLTLNVLQRKIEQEVVAAPQKFERRLAPPPFAVCVVVELDLDYIKRELIPTLGKRYFASGDGALDYDLAIVSRETPEKIIYESTSQTVSGASHPDATADLFSVKFGLINGFLFENGPLTKPFSAPEGLPRVVAVAAPPPNRPQEEPPPSITWSNNAGAAWQLVLRHRSGSLNEAVASVHRRNLFVNFGILLLLAGSVVMITIYTQRAQRLARQQLEFVAGVSHELRTPVAAVCIASENLADGVVKEHAQVKQYGVMLRNQGRQLSEMIEQVLEFAGTGSLRKAYQLRPVAAEELVEKALAVCHEQAQAKNFDIERDVEPDLPLVMADESAINRALQNLISNAMKYSGESRRIVVRARRIESKRKSEFEITIKDQGLGIEPEDLPHIFEPFRRGRPAIEAQIHGNGLGLSLVKRIMKAHGGRVSVRSKPGQGSAFTLHLPVAARLNESRY